MGNLVIKEIEEYLYKEVEEIVDILFEKLRANNINVNLERGELNKKELETYLIIYNEYEGELIKLRNRTLIKYGYIENLDTIFAAIIQNVVSKKQEL